MLAHLKLCEKRLLGLVCPVLNTEGDVPQLFPHVTSLSSGKTLQSVNHVLGPDQGVALLALVQPKSRKPSRLVSPGEQASFRQSVA